MIKRRRLLLGGLGVGALAALGVWGAGMAAEAEIASAVRRRLAFLRLDEAGLQAFAKDYIRLEKDHIRTTLAKHPTWYSWKIRAYSFFHRPVDSLGLLHETRSRRERLEQDWATLFMLSSDFFASGATESRVVRYVALYDPMRACGNPFARPALATQEVKPQNQL